MLLILFWVLHNLAFVYINIYLFLLTSIWLIFKMSAYLFFSLKGLFFITIQILSILQCNSVSEFQFQCTALGICNNSCGVLEKHLLCLLHYLLTIIRNYYNTEKIFSQFKAQNFLRIFWIWGKFVKKVLQLVHFSKNTKISTQNLNPKKEAEKEKG